MTDPFMAEVRMVGFGYAPRGWAQCNGALLPIAQATAMFSLLGIAYGGDGRVTFGLPNLTGGRAALGAGDGPGLTSRARGDIGGLQGVTLSNAQIPPHVHQVNASATPADTAAPDVAVSLGRSVGQRAYAPPGTTVQQLHPEAVGTAPGGPMPHNNMMPFTVLNYCICLQGVYPQRP